MAKCFRGSRDYELKRRTFDGQRSTNRRAFKRHARRMLRRRGVCRSYLILWHFINHP